MTGRIRKLYLIVGLLALLLPALAILVASFRTGSQPPSSEKEPPIGAIQQGMGKQGEETRMIG